MVAQSQAREREVALSRGSAGGRRLVARSRPCGAELRGRACGAEPREQGTRRGGGCMRRTWLGRFVDRLGPGDGPIGDE
jgi:hypothetical protein